MQIVRWGNGGGQSRHLPPTGWTWQASIEGGMWRNLDTAFVDIPGALGYERGVWYAIREGIRGLLVADEQGVAVCYMICEPTASDVNIALFNGCPKPTALEGPTCRLYETPYCHTGYVTSRTRATDATSSRVRQALPLMQTASFSDPA